MTQHRHREHIAGCYRCELSRDEVDEERRDEFERLLDEARARYRAPLDRLAES